ncbi:hypothetical protein AB1Y20_018867 [Prymnesium parvum]|uniref:Nucleolus and neural progenitor protein-like N-terminal domain-containing protein n=1 Tax=Prymnesium parvum TaxID=97485 RepID=A0AB34JTJ7_PRYPA
MTSASSLARARRSLAEEVQLLDSLLRAHQLQHRRALYMQRLLDVRRRLKAVLLSCEEPSLRAGRVQHAVDAAELALERIAPAWLALRELLAQTYFMPFALCLLALLSKAATLVAQLHAGLCASYHGVAGRGRPALLALYHAPDATTALSRVFGAEAAGGAKSGLSSSECVAVQPSLPQTLAEDLGEAEDLGQVETEPCVEESIAPAAINSQDES